MTMRDARWRNFRRNTVRRSLAVAVAACCLPAVLMAGPQAPQGNRAQAPAARPAMPAPAPGASAGVRVPEDYVIGPEDVLLISFWRDDSMSGEAVVRPDGKITLKLLNDIDVVGLTPEQLREKLAKDATKFLEEPAPTVIVKQINSRKVFITGEVAKPGPYPLNAPTTVMQLITLASGLNEYAKREEIGILRTENGKTIRLPFNYEDVSKGKKLEQNVLLKPGDTVIVP
jgi:polysaccharide biosynthesis/export protein